MIQGLATRKTARAQMPLQMRLVERLDPQASGYVRDIPRLTACIDRSAVIFTHLGVSCPSGGTGRRAGFKIPFLRECRFDSGGGHHLILKPEI